MGHVSSAGEIRFLERAPRHQPVWHHRAACRDAPLDLFFDDGQAVGKPNAVNLHRRELAKAYCSRCPVMKLCLELYLGENHGVFGGMDADERSSYRAMMSRQQARTDGGQLGEDIAEARRNGVYWTRLAEEYQVRPRTLKSYLTTYLRSRADMSEAPETVDPLLEPAELSPPAWGDSWVLQQGRHYPAAYQGESADEEPWFFMSIDFGRSHTRKWVPSDAVVLARRVDRRVIQRKGVLTSGPRIDPVGDGEHTASTPGADAPVVLGEEHPGHVREAVGADAPGGRA